MFVVVLSDFNGERKNREQDLTLRHFVYNIDLGCGIFHHLTVGGTPYVQKHNRRQCSCNIGAPQRRRHVDEKVITHVVLWWRHNFSNVLMALTRNEWIKNKQASLTVPNTTIGLSNAKIAVGFIIQCPEHARVSSYFSSSSAFTSFCVQMTHCKYFSRSMRYKYNI